MTYLVDANVLSEPTKRTPNPRVVDTGLCWAELLARLRARGEPMQVKDSLIAATALAKGFVLATRNRRDFEASGVEIVDPFS